MKNYLSERANELDSLLENVIRDGKAVGVAVSAFDSAGNILYERFMGWRDEEKQLPLNENTLMGLASITKSFTAVGIMQLVEKGVLDLSSPVKKYVPEFERGDITLQHLLSHCAGYFPLPRPVINDLCKEIGLSYEKDGELARHEGLAREAAKRLVARMNEQTEFTGRPGENFSYSNDGFALLCDILRCYGGCATYTDYLDKHVLGPIGMTRSSCNFEWPGDDNVTKLYQLDKGKMTSHHDFYDRAFALMGEGNMRSTIADMRRYVCMYLNRGKTDGGRVLSSYSVREMTKPRQICGLNNYYGYGLMIKPDREISIVGHGGNLTGVASQMAWCYETGVGVIVISNTSGTQSIKISEGVIRASANFSPTALPPAPREVEWSREFLDKACGTYESGEGMVLIVSQKDGKPVVNVRGEEPLECTALNPYMLLVKLPNSEMQIAFYQNDDGVVWAIGGGYRIIPRKKDTP